MIDFNKPVQTRDGRKVRILCTDAKCGMPIVALVMANTGTEVPVAYYKDGAIFNSTNDSGADLINVPEEHTVWVNIQKAHKEGLEPGLAILHKTRMIADNYAVNRIACIKVTYTEGEGLD